MAKKFFISLLLAVQCGAYGVHAAQAPYLFDVLKRPVYRKTWNALLASYKPIPPWIIIFSKTYNGVAAPALMPLPSMASHIKPSTSASHTDCEAYELEVYFDGGRRQSLWRAHADPSFQGLRFLGSPPASVAAALSKALNP